MTAHTNLERRLADYYTSEPPLRAPDRVLLAALATIDTTPQRRGLLAPWRSSNVSNIAKLAAAAVVVVALGAIAITALPNRQPPGAGGTSVPSSTAAPSPTALESDRPGPTTYVPGALTSTFTSNVHGVALSYPEGWAAQAATDPWTEGDPPLFGLPTGDFLYDTDLEDHLFLAVGSRPLGGTALEDWMSDFMAAEGCGTIDAVVVDGADGLIGAACEIAVVSIEGRGYVFGLFASTDDAELDELDTRSLFLDILTTVQLLPEDALE